jgi:hypothetical protein
MTLAWPSVVALTTAVVPEIATETPKPLREAVSDPLSSAVCLQPVAVLVNTYARPALLP